MSELSPGTRLTGTETEWAAALYLPGGRRMEDASRGIIQAMHSMYALPGVPGVHGGRFFMNGVAHAYIDIGLHPETCTIETPDIWDVVASEAVGADMMYAALETQRVVDEDGNVLVEPALYKVVRDDSGEVWGYHNSILFARKYLGVKPKRLALFGLHQATKSVYAGSGYWRANGEFLLSQKVSAAVQDYSLDSTQRRPVVNLRNEPLTADGRYGRLHNISNDPAISPWQGFVTLGTDRLLVDIMEQGRRLPSIEEVGGDSLWRIARQVAGDLTMKQTVRLAGGRTIRPLEIQAALWELADQHTDDPQGREIVDEWANALEQLETNPLSLGAKSGWTLRYLKGRRVSDNAKRLIEVRRLARVGTPEYNRRFRLKVDPDHNIEARIEARRKGPAVGSRAYARAQKIEEVWRGRRSGNLPPGTEAPESDWHIVRDHEQNYLFNDPYATEAEVVPAYSHDSLPDPSPEYEWLGWL